MTLSQFPYSIGGWTIEASPHRVVGKITGDNASKTLSSVWQRIEKAPRRHSCVMLNDRVKEIT